MAHAVETMAYNEKEMPWHGLGTPVPADISLDDMIVKAGLDWEVEARKIAIADADGNWQHDPKRLAMVRSTDNKVFDVTSKYWTPVQNRDAFEFFRSFCDAGQVRMETAGSLRDGRIIWGLANIEKTIKLRDGDELKGYLLLSNSHAAGQALTIRPTFVRVVCANTLSMALGAKWGSTNAKRREGDRTFSMNHTKVFDQAMIDEARQCIGIAGDDLSAFGKLGAQLKKLKLSDTDVASLLTPMYDKKLAKKDLVNYDKYSRTMTQVMESYHKAPGADPGTAWGVLNAVTHFEDHVRGNAQSTRMTSAWFGQASRRKQRIARKLDLMAS